MTHGAVLLAYEANDVKPGWLAFWIVMALCAALALLMRSFAKHLKRIDFDEGPRRTSAATRKGTGPGDGATPRFARRRPPPES